MTGDVVKLAVRHVRKTFRMRGRRETEDRILHALTSLVRRAEEQFAPWRMADT